MLVCFRWLGMNLEIVANVVVFGAAIFSVVTPGIEGGTIGLSVSYAMQVRLRRVLHVICQAIGLIGYLADCWLIIWLTD